MASKQVPNVAACLHGQVLLWRVRLIFIVALVGDFVATRAVWVSPRYRQEVTEKRRRAEPPTIALSRHLTWYCVVCFGRFCEKRRWVL